MAERASIEAKYKWKVEDIFKTEQDWEKAFQEANRQKDAVLKYRKKLNNKADILACLKEGDAFNELLGQIYCYTSLKKDEDTRAAKYMGMLDRVMGLITQYSANSSFIEPELTQLSDSDLDKMIADSDMKDYDYLLRKVKKQKSHILSEQEERILAAGSDIMGGYHDVFTMIDNADLNLPEVSLDGEKVKLTHGMYSVMMQSSNRDHRKLCYENYYLAYKKLIHTIAATYNNNVKADCFYTKMRGYSSCLERALANEDVEPKVYNTLIEQVNKNLKTMHEYVEYKKKALGYDKMHMYDMYVPTVPGKDIRVPYEKACEMVKEGLACMGADYQALLNRAFSEGWIDVYETEGKRSGAYSSGGLYNNHPFVLLNYQQTTHDVFTIAHELGHALHSYHSNKAQPMSKADYVIFVAEVASTVNEVLLLKHITAKTTDKELKKYLLTYLLEMLRTTLFRQTQFAEFEAVAHGMAEDGIPLTYETLCEKYLELNRKYYGPIIEKDDEIEFEWARIPHFYRSFYVYKYATGIISAVSIADNILEKGDSYVQKYRKFLSSGGSDSPVQLLKIADIDLTTQTPYEKAMKVFQDTLAELKKL